MARARQILKTAGLAAALAALLCPACRMPPPRVDRARTGPRAPAAEALAHYATGLALEAREAWEEAREHYRLALQYDSQSPELIIRRGEMDRRLEDAGALAERAEELLRLPRRTSETVRSAGWFYQAAGRHDEAVKAYHEALRMDPGPAETYQLLSVALLRREDLPGALAVLQDAMLKSSNPGTLAPLAGAVYLQAHVQDPDRTAQVDPEPFLLHLEQKIADDQADPGEVWLLMEVYHALGRREDVMRHGRQIAEQAEQNPALGEYLATVYLVLDYAAEAREVLQARLAHQEPSGPHIRILLGRLEWDHGDRDQAFTYAEEALADEELRGQDVVALALHYAETDAEAAERLLEKALEHRPADPSLSLALARLWSQRGAWTNAGTLLAAALSTLDPAPPALLFMYAWALHAQGEEQQAATALETLGTVTPNLLRDWFRRALNWEHPGLPVRAVAFLEHAAEYSATMGSLHFARGLLYSAIEDYAAAYEALQQAMTADGELPRSADGFFMLGAAAERTGHYDEAERAFRRCLEKDSDHALGLNYLAYMWAEQGRELDEALRLSRRSLELDPENGAFIDTLGWIYYQMGRYEEALTELQRASAVLPEDATVADHLGDAYLKTGQPDKALYHWRRALAIEPENEAIREKIARHENQEPAAVPQER